MAKKNESKNEIKKMIIKITKFIKAKDVYSENKMIYNYLWNTYDFCWMPFSLEAYG